MPTSIAPLTKLAAWQAFEAHCLKARELQLQKLSRGRSKAQEAHDSRGRRRLLWLRELLHGR